MNQFEPPQLSALESKELEKIQKTQHFKKGDILIREHDIMHQYYIVIKGCVRSYSLINDEEITVDFFTENQTVLPAIIGKNNPSPYFLVCEEDCSLSVVNEKTEQSAFAKFPRLKQLCQQSTEQMLIQSQNEQIRFKSSTPEQRYEYLFTQRPDLFHRVAQHKIASYLGIKPESLSRLRKRLDNNKTI